MNEVPYTDLRDLQLKLKEGVQELFPGKVWVKAQISSLKVNAQSGHCYLELAQTEGGKVVAKAGAVIWKRDYLLIDSFFHKATGSHLQAGQEVLVQVRVSYSELWGLTLTVEDVNPEFTLGEARLLRQRTIARLEEEGLMDLQKELCLPDLPRRLAVISAPDAAGMGDFRRHLLENEYGFAFIVDLFPAVMQGAGAPESIRAALGRIRLSPVAYDAALLLRGGGSELDLACFDDYDIAEAIARLPIPVITAVGHDKDVHVADLVANRAVKTPTALADLFLSLFISEDGRIGDLQQRILSGASRLVELALSRVDALGKLVTSLALARIAAEEARLDGWNARIVLSDPRSLLGRGVPLLADARGVRFDSAASRRAGERISVRLPDGRLDCTVDAVSLSGPLNTASETT